jgi:hypothetical protein
MNQLKRTAFALLLGAFFLSSCEQDHEGNELTTTVSNNNITMTGAQVVPPNSSTATGQISATYDRKSKILSYKITWSGLTAAVTAIHVHGLADAGYLALVAPIQVISGNSTAVSGSYSGTLFVDGIAVKENDVLAGQYYIDIHTNNPVFNVTGEIRGQITFPN